jgi:alkyl hydroperoxide reductase subunit F
MYDLMIIGAGPAGMTGAIYAARKRMNLVVVSENVGGQTLWTDCVENYPGFTCIKGIDLVSKFEEHIKSFNIKLEYGRVERLSKIPEGFVANLEDGRTIDARTCVIASGKSPRTLGVPGEKELLAKGVAYCATCDAPLFAGLNVAVVGGGNSGVGAAIQLMQICPKVYLVESESSLKADEILRDKMLAGGNVEILTDTVPVEIIGDNFVTGFKVRNKKTQEERIIEVQGVFVEIGLEPNSSFVADLVSLTNKKEIPVNCRAETGVPGLFAAGDVTDVPAKQIIIAAGDGAKAALGAYDYLLHLRQPAG